LRQWWKAASLAWARREHRRRREWTLSFRAGAVGPRSDQHTPVNRLCHPGGGGDGGRLRRAVSPGHGLRKRFAQATASSAAPILVPARVAGGWEDTPNGEDRRGYEQCVATGMIGAVRRPLDLLSQEGQRPKSSGGRISRTSHRAYRPAGRAPDGNGGVADIFPTTDRHGAKQCRLTWSRDQLKRCDGQRVER